MKNDSRDGEEVYWCVGLVYFRGFLRGGCQYILIFDTSDLTHQVPRPPQLRFGDILYFQVCNVMGAVAPASHLIEIKLGGQSLINDGAATLTALSNRIDTSKMKEPVFKMILTATGDYAYRRPEDGIYVVPIGCLQP